MTGIGAYGAAAGGLGALGAGIALVAVVRVLRGQGHHPAPQPPPGVYLPDAPPDSVLGYHGEPSEDELPHGWLAQVYHLCPPCGRMQPGVHLPDGAFRCYAAGHTTPEESPHA